MNIKIKNITQKPEPADGYRIYVERNWPLGVDRGEAEVHAWLKDIAPSEGAYYWFSGKPERWGEFECGYFAELDDKYDHVMKVVDKAQSGTVTLLHGESDNRFNSAAALRDYIEMKKEMLLTRTAA
jgi:uncharacterized protein YeaO (DUF488 family)